MMDYSKEFNVGDRLIVEIKNDFKNFNGIYVGGGKDYVELNEVTQDGNPNKLKGIYEFCRNEIEKIHHLKKPLVKPLETNLSTPSTAIKLLEDEYFRLKDMARSYTYIGQLDNRFFDAMKLFGDAETIGIAAFGSDLSRTTSLNLLAMSTWKHVYIFDLSQMKKMYDELKQIFECNSIMKVVHKSAWFVEILHRQYGVYMQNVFDTQLVDLMIRKSSNEKNLSECLVEYLNFPQTVLERAMAVPMSMWAERPLNSNLKLFASQLTTYLFPLKDQLLHLLLKDAFKKIEQVQDAVYDMDDYDFESYNTGKTLSKQLQDLLL